MPTSNLALAPLVLNYMAELKPATVLDVGPGHGKYGVLLKEYLDPSPIVDAVEGYGPYVDEFYLYGIYREVFIDDIMRVPAEKLATYDAVLMCDVIEHLTKSDGRLLLDRLAVTNTVICTPATFFHNPDGLPWTETHRSLWTVDDFDATDRVDRAETYLGGIVIRLRKDTD